MKAGRTILDLWNFGLKDQRNSRTKAMIKAVLFCVAFTGIFVVFSYAKHLLPNNLERLAHGIMGTLAALFTTALFLRSDKRRFSDIGLSFGRRTMVKFFAGVIVGIITMGLLAGSVMYFTHVSIEINPKRNVPLFLLMTLPLIPLAFMEELGFRGYPLQILKGKLGIRLSIILTSVLFALYHVANGWTVASSFYGPGVWGLLFGLAAVYSRGIAMPTGLHYAANLTTAAFGATGNNVSIWTIAQMNSPTSKYGGVDWVTLLPALALLVFALIGIELYMQQMRAANNSLVSGGD